MAASREALVDPGAPLDAAAVEDRDDVAGNQPEHTSEVMGFVGTQSRRSALGVEIGSVEARQHTSDLATLFPGEDERPPAVFFG